MNLDKDLSEEQLSYNSAFLFALIDNVSYISFKSDMSKITIERHFIEEKYNADLVELTDDKEELLRVIGY